MCRGHERMRLFATERRLSLWPRADVLVRPVAEVVGPLSMSDVAAGDATRELGGVLGPGVPLEDWSSELAHDEDRVGVIAKRCYGEPLRCRDAREQFPGVAVPEGSHGVATGRQHPAAVRGVGEPVWPRNRWS